MSLQKYRADEQGEKQSDGAIPFYTRWMGGPTLALIRHCSTPFGPRTVYVTGEADTWSSLPAACTFRRRTIHGCITIDRYDGGRYVFHPYHFNSIYPTVEEG